MAVKQKHRMLYIDTSLRNPKRTKSFLEVLDLFDQKKLTNQVATHVERQLIMENLYSPKGGYKKKEAYTKKEAQQIMNDNPQDHQQGGFEGYASRFITHYFNINQLGYILCEKDEKITIGDSGKELVRLEEEEENKISMLHLNSLAHWQSNNPHSANLSLQKPIILLLKLIKKNIEKKGCGIPTVEIPIIMCWQNNDENELYTYLCEFRNEYSLIKKRPLNKNIEEKIDDLVLQYCQNIFGDKWEGLNKKGKLKLASTLTAKKTILKDYPDVYIRSMRHTGLIIKKREKGVSRLDYDKNQQNLVDYIILKYSNITKFQDTQSYFKYASKIDPKIVNINYIETFTDDKFLDQWLKEFTMATVIKELLGITKPSKHEILSFVPPPLRIEWLLALFTYGQCKKSLDKIEPRYKVSDDGQAVNHASGQSKKYSGVDMIAHEGDMFFNIEATTITNSSQKDAECTRVCRHLDTEQKNHPGKKGMCLLIAPEIHFDTIQQCDYYSNRKHMAAYNIKPISVSDYIKKLEKSKSLSVFFD